MNVKKCPLEHKNVPGQAQTWTSQSRGKCTNHEATAPSH